jgi:putative heme iron utilization protein
MNADHADMLRACCLKVHGLEAETATMIGIDPDGFDVRAGDRLLRFPFDSAVTDASEARTALVAMAQQCRS